ncbi:hypothetical protein CEXT_450721 [Caerostris extrusa]|uniref:Uncharacterized protein n=1 Tax=Caerostris extrusa TaxID=172846 RepID=A0AAV4T4C8_CAEEX|nr:hypothetical protein CEXT_450721 [Caerostris extrusa]
MARFVLATPVCREDANCNRVLPHLSCKTTTQAINVPKNWKQGVGGVDKVERDHPGCSPPPLQPPFKLPFSGIFLSVCGTRVGLTWEVVLPWTLTGRNINPFWDGSKLEMEIGDNKRDGGIFFNIYIYVGPSRRNGYWPLCVLLLKKESYCAHM